MLNQKSIIKVISVLSECCNLRRWSAVKSDSPYNELNKQAFNCAISFYIAQELKHLGVNIDFTKFPKIAIARLFERSIICDLRESMLDSLSEYGIPKEVIVAKIYDDIAKSTSDSFKRFIYVTEDSVESKIFKLSTKIATLLELHEIKHILPDSNVLKKEKEIREDLNKLNDFFVGIDNIPILKDDKVLEIFSKYSSLRNRMRWAKQPHLVDCSVLGHQMDTAVFAYLESIESNPNDEIKATQLFWMGIFHDFPEAWTGDMPSPLKDSIPGLRKATEQLELHIMEKEVFSNLPDYMVKPFQSVMLESKANASYKQMLKNADYDSADCECQRQLVAGSHSEYFKDVLKRSYLNKENRSRLRRLMIEYLYGVMLNC